MEINEQIVDFVNSEIPKLQAEKAELEERLKNINDDLFALEHLLNRAKIITKNNIIVSEV